MAPKIWFWKWKGMFITWTFIILLIYAIKVYKISLPIHKNNCVSMLQEVFCWNWSSCTSAEIVYESHCIMFQRYRCTSALQCYELVCRRKISCKRKSWNLLSPIPLCYPSRDVFQWIPSTPVHSAPGPEEVDVLHRNLPTLRPF